MAGFQMSTEVLAELMPSLRAPVIWCDGARLRLPSDPVGSVVVTNIGRLMRSPQQRLLDWLNDQGNHARIIATSATSVFPWVTQGIFSEGLYYRINTVTLVLNQANGLFYRSDVCHPKRAGAASCSSG